MSRTFLVLLHYDGGGFVGWQRQAAGRSVQGELETVVGRLANRRTVAHAVGRTDTGVHARGMGVSLSMPRTWSSQTLRRAMNGLLPPDCWVERVHEMAPGFHARKSAMARHYQYLVGTDEAAGSPFRRRYEWALRRELDGAAMERAAGQILGTHDFRPFAVKGAPKPHYRCTVRRAQWEPRADGEGFKFSITADRFLHHMVRLLVGTMVDVGLGRRPESDMMALLARQDNAETSPPAPPEGLYFVSAEYPAECFRDSEGNG